eukprot:512360-Pleurochrysis_carterae.AAC.2
MCMCDRTFSIKKDHIVSASSGNPAALTSARTLSRRFDISSGAYRPGTSPEVSMPLMSSRKELSITCGGAGYEACKKCRKKEGKLKNERRRTLQASLDPVQSQTFDSR